MSLVMHPAMMSAVSSALQIGLASATVSPTLRKQGRKTLPAITLSALLILSGCLVAQALDPTLLTLVERNAPSISHGQYYRLFTALWFQDGGVGGGMLNLLMLAVVGWQAEGELGPGPWVGAYLIGGLTGQLAGLWWAPVGAGNSVATLGLAGCLMARRAIAARHVVSGRSAICFGLAGLMIALRDFHGVAVMAGGMTGLIKPFARPQVGEGMRRGSPARQGPIEDLRDSPRDDDDRTPS